MAADGLWPSIQKNGLLSVSGLLDLYGVTGTHRHAIESARRPQCVELNDPVHGRAVIRDNKPMTDAGLGKCLQDGLKPVDWYRILNRKSFFWVTRERLELLLKARAYAKQPQTILEVDTAKLLERHRDNVRLALMNTGQTLYIPKARGNATFMTIAGFPDEGTGRLGTSKRPKVVELVVEGGVPDIRECVIRVDRVERGNWSPIWP
jgi:hypothetical protein